MPSLIDKVWLAFLNWLVRILTSAEAKLENQDPVAGRTFVLTDMRAFDPSPGPFLYDEHELLHREKGIASFAVKAPWNDIRWAVTFGAIADYDPQWQDVISGMRKHKDALIGRATEMFMAGELEPDGCLIVRELRVQS